MSWKSSCVKVKAVILSAAKDPDEADPCTTDRTFLHESSAFVLAHPPHRPPYKLIPCPKAQPSPASSPSPAQPPAPLCAQPRPPALSPANGSPPTATAARAAIPALRLRRAHSGRRWRGPRRAFPSSWVSRPTTSPSTPGCSPRSDFALTHNHPRLRVVSDSELMVKQIQGRYKVKSPLLRPLFDLAKKKIAQLGRLRDHPRPAPQK